ncbi:hypothetical protein DEU56DRAFT_179466 [Suillus clintonianus]|uniref:uncharacterized protein n=1 Tax=Suillus clintonianus TaxID=1904413 RepID=UPI001B861F72|nr:uncharacterized protein DEU56DRAFT_179466 [Suillus clintonianus]KAG2115009.1 hypothetical protein DEU56DRAFT_179466 [Suillus clintonianus]
MINFTRDVEQHLERSSSARGSSIGDLRGATANHLDDLKRAIDGVNDIESLRVPYKISTAGSWYRCNRAGVGQLEGLAQHASLEGYTRVLAENALEGGTVI